MYFVLEIQKRTDGSWHHTVFQYDDRQAAEAKYYYILSEAVVAQIPVNGAMLINALTGETMLSKVFQHGEWEGYVPPEEEE